MTTNTNTATFKDAAAVVLSEKFIDKKPTLKEGVSYSYLNWASAVALAGRPSQTVVQFERGKPFTSIFGTALVAVDMMVGEVSQRTWLPVLDARNQSILSTQVDCRDVTDTIQRCKAKAIAMVKGAGLSVYAGFDGDGQKFINGLNIKPEDDLSTVKPVVSKNGPAEYIDWSSALAAARITDPNFSWSVQTFEVLDEETGEVIKDHLACKVGTSWVVAINVIYKGIQHTEFLPIIGIVEIKGKKRSHMPLTAPDAWDWNKSVMRCLAKSISVVTGYGLSVYAKEDVSELPEILNDEQRTARFCEEQQAMFERAQGWIAAIKSPRSRDIIASRIVNVFQDGKLSEEQKMELETKLAAVTI